MSALPAIAVDRLSKSYRVYDTPLDALKEALTHRPRHREFLALDEVSFSIARGERVGIVGANGAGKSTLLRILSGTLDHTGGRYAIAGRLRAVLELGTGFHEECTGRENILMGGLCMGYARRELLARLDWIVAFSELGRVIDQPLRTYSSGMKSRLMYAVAFCMPVEIMIVDEALATGDGAFVRKCTQHIVDLCSHGTTALVVSHNLYFLERLCDRVLYLRHGRLVADGEPLAVCKQYEADLGRDFVESAAPPAAGAFLRADEPVPPPDCDRDGERHRESDRERDHEPDRERDHELDVEPLPAPSDAPRENGAGEVLQPDGLWQRFDFTGAPAVRALHLVRLREAALLDEHGRRTGEIVTGRPARLRFVLESRVRKRDVHIGFMLWNDRDVHVATTTNVCSLDEHGRPNGVRLHLTEGVFAVEVALPSLRLGAGRYWLRFGVAAGHEHYSDDDLLLSENRCLAFAVLRPDHVQDVLHEPVSRWSGLQRLADLPAIAPAPAASPVGAPAAREATRGQPVG